VSGLVVLPCKPGTALSQKSPVVDESRNTQGHVIFLGYLFLAAVSSQSQRKTAPTDRVF
jgi:hypothetical protein